MNRNIEIFESLMQREGMVSPIPEEIRRRIESIKSAEMRKTLKRAGVAAVIIWLLSLRNLRINRFGMSVPVLKAAAGALIMAAAAAVIYFSVTRVERADSAGRTSEQRISVPQNIDEAPLTTGNAVTSVRTSFPQKEKQTGMPVSDGISQSAPRYDVVFGRFTSFEVEGPARDRISASLYSAVSGRIKGAASRDSDDVRGGRLLALGSVEKNSGSITLTVRIVDIKDSRVLHVAVRDYDSEEEAAAGVDGIADELSRVINRFSGQ